MTILDMSFIWEEQVRGCTACSVCVVGGALQASTPCPALLLAAQTPESGKEVPAAAIKTDEELAKFTVRQCCVCSMVHVGGAMLARAGIPRGALVLPASPASWPGQGSAMEAAAAAAAQQRVRMPACPAPPPAAAQVDEHLSELERTVLFLNGGLLLQQRHAIARSGRVPGAAPRERSGGKPPGTCLARSRLRRALCCAQHYPV